MADIDYPPTIQQRFNRAGYNKVLSDDVLRSDVDEGVARTRLKCTLGSDEVTGTIDATRSELQTFKDWHRLDLMRGVLRFNWVDPDDGMTPVEMKFKKPPGISKIGGEYFRIFMNLEILP